MTKKKKGDKMTKEKHNLIIYIGFMFGLLFWLVGIV